MGDNVDNIDGDGATGYNNDNGDGATDDDGNGETSNNIDVDGDLELRARLPPPSSLPTPRLVGG